jgi:flavin-dependent dehydrogenase
MTYGNYQLVSERGVGPGWALVGDAFGFVDPMLSPGVFLALRSAEALARTLDPAIDRPATLHEPPVTVALADYERRMQGDLVAWMELVASIYEGRLFGLYRAGQQLTREHDNAWTRFMERHIGHHVAGMASGARTTSRYSRTLIRFLSKHGMRGIDPREMAIR